MLQVPLGQTPESSESRGLRTLGMGFALGVLATLAFTAYTNHRWPEKNTPNRRRRR